METKEIYYVVEKGEQRMLDRYALTEDIKCKYCGSRNLWLYGKYKGVQRFYCRDCKRKFAGAFTLPKMRSPVTDVGDALHSYFSGMSLNKIRYDIEQQHKYRPSSSTIYRWVNRFTKVAEDKIKDTKPNVGDVWVCDETVLNSGGRKVWFWDIIDAKTRFLLASRLSTSRATKEAALVLNEARRRAGKSPKRLLTDKMGAYVNAVDLVFGSKTEHVATLPFTVKVNTNIIERFHGTLKDRTKVLRGLKTPETARRFLEGWLIDYNYFRPHISLNGKTPAQKAGIELSTTDWLDIVREPKHTATIEIAREPRPILRLHPLRPNEFYAGGGAVSRHHFRGARRRKLC